MKFALTIVAALACAAQAHADVLDRLQAGNALWYDAAGAVYGADAVKPYRHVASLSNVGAGYVGRHDSAVLHDCEGRGSNIGVFDASAYVHADSVSTLWGHARYENGSRLDVTMCEAVDIDIVYPYYTADDVGGNMRHERYAFGGGYGHTGDKFDYGLSMSYDASFGYRAVDPRPKCVTGKLDMSASVGLHVGGYRVAVGADVQKYRQTASLQFVSEIGESPFYHTTGLGTVYARFNSLGKSTYYHGWRYGASLSFVPAERYGGFATMSFRRFTFDYVLRDLNNLPMSEVGDNELYVVAGWRGKLGGADVAAFASLKSSRRKGTENIFGDAASGVYPQIYSLQMYTHDNTASSLSLDWCRTFGASSLDVLVSGGYESSDEEYVTPRRAADVGVWYARCDIRFVRRLSNRVQLAATAGVSSKFSGKSSSEGIGDADVVSASALKDYMASASAAKGYGAEVELMYALPGLHRAIGVSAAYTGASTDYMNVKSNIVEASLSFIF